MKHQRPLDWGFPITLSRNTDVPTFHMKKFFQWKDQGHFDAAHPQTGIPCRWSIGPRDVHSLVWWSKDYRPLLDVHRSLAGQCVYCWHCHPCPQKINMAGVIWLVDLAEGGVTKELRAMYARHKGKASRCNECGVCLERCAFQVDAIAKMRRAVELFEGRTRCADGRTTGPVVT